MCRILSSHSNGSSYPHLITMSSLFYKELLSTQNQRETLKQARHDIKLMPSTYVTRPVQTILVPIAFFTSLSRWDLGTSILVSRPHRLREAKRAMGTRMSSVSLLRNRFLGCHATLRCEQPFLWGGALRDIPKNGCGGD